MPTHWEVVTALLDPGFYPHPVGKVRRISTHVSELFLTGRYVYKMKRAVDLGVMGWENYDATRLETRKQLCEVELALNRRLAPGLYVDVVPVTWEANGRLVLGGRGQPLEWLVRMTEFGQEQLFGNLLAADRLTPELVEQTALELARFHRGLPPHPLAGHYGSVAGITRVIEGELQQLRPFQGVTLETGQWRHLHHWMKTVLVSHAGLFTQRLEQGHVREGHGDLHLGNLCLWQDRPTPFDALDTTSSLRVADTVADWAFLVMDIKAHRRPDLANRFANAYLQESDDFAGIPLAPFYLAYRAMVRAKVASLRMEGAKGQRRELWKQAARHYADMALSHTRSRRGGVVMVCGLSGSGKSLTARDLASRVNAVVIRSDAVRKHLLGLTPHDRAPESAYTSEMHQRTLDGMLERAAFSTVTGYWTILDAAFLRREERVKVKAWAQQRGLSVHLLHVTCDEVLRLRYVEERARAGRDISDADLAVAVAQSAWFQPPGEEECPILVDASGPARLDGVVKLLTGGGETLS